MDRDSSGSQSMQRWDIGQERAHFRQIWESRQAGDERKHTSAFWDERAHQWAKELEEKERRERSDARVKAMTSYLRTHGLLAASHDVIDIGCGLGRFVAAAAKTARHVVGTDISGQMLLYGARYAKEEGVENTSFVEADLKEADLDAFGWRKRFDLVFAAITPAITGEGLEKMMEMSRGWCFNSCFVSFKDELEEELSRNVLGREPRNPKSQHWQGFYALFNLLFLGGYLPETTYHAEEKTTVYLADQETAQIWAKRLAGRYELKEEALKAPILRYLTDRADQDGRLVRKDTCQYGWILWKV